jgi:hypothetical protein
VILRLLPRRTQNGTFYFRDNRIGKVESPLNAYVLQQLAQVFWQVFYRPSMSPLVAGAQEELHVRLTAGSPRVI